MRTYAAFGLLALASSGVMAAPASPDLPPDSPLPMSAPNSPDPSRATSDMAAFPSAPPFEVDIPRLGPLPGKLATPAGGLLPKLPLRPRAGKTPYREYEQWLYQQQKDPSQTVTEPQVKPHDPKEAHNPAHPSGQEQLKEQKQHHRANSSDLEDYKGVVPHKRAASDGGGPVMPLDDIVGKFQKMPNASAPKAGPARLPSERRDIGSSFSGLNLLDPTLPDAPAPAAANAPAQIAPGEEAIHKSPPLRMRRAPYPQPVPVDDMVIHSNGFLDKVPNLSHTG